jgi:ferrochelatase
MLENALLSGVLLVNLGSPATPQKADVRRYLNEFLMDERVLDYPYLVRRFIVSAFILPSRPARSAAAYQSIWWKEGSPLIVISQSLSAALQKQVQVPVVLAMRYGNPSIRAGIAELVKHQIKQILVIPLYPHFAMSTFETVIEETRRVTAQFFPEMRLEFLPPFYDSPTYIEALVDTARPYLDTEYDHLLFSYHGIPVRHLRKTDPTGRHCLQTPDCCSVASPAHVSCYRHQVLRTAELFTHRAGISEEKVSVAFQSRLGRDAWLQPSTEEEIRRLALSGVRKLLVICPSFTADCLETLEEIGERGKQQFLQAGGEKFQLIPCLNDSPVWVNTLASWINERLTNFAPAIKMVMPEPRKGRS